MPRTIDTTEDDYEPYERPPEGEEIGLREARTVLGPLTNQAYYQDRVTYLTRQGNRVAAIVPAEAARTRTQTAEAIEDRRSSERAARQRLRDLQTEFARQATHQVRQWARDYLKVCEAADRAAEAAGHPSPIVGTLHTRRVRAADVVAGTHDWTGHRKDIQ